MIDPIDRLGDWAGVFQSDNLRICESANGTTSVRTDQHYRSCLSTKRGTVREMIDRLLQIPLPAPREIIVVNDGSTDGTQRGLDGLAASGGGAVDRARPAQRREGERHPHRSRAHPGARSWRSRTPISSSIRSSPAPWCSRFSISEADVVYGSQISERAVLLVRGCRLPPTVGLPG